jgi:hypothetical protein
MIYIHLAPRLGMSGAVPILPTYLHDLCRDNFTFAYFLTGEISLASVGQQKGRIKFIQMAA